jgi:hypothetical protein
MEFTSANHQDIKRYYEHTYVKFDEFGDRLFYIDHVDQFKVSGTDDNDTAFELYLDNVHPYVVNYLLPHKAVFQWKDSVYLLQRIPARQYKRGLCAENTMITNVATSQLVDLGFQVLKAFVSKPSYASFTSAFTSKIKTKAVALTTRMSYLRTGTLLMDNIKIATFNFDTKKIHMLRKNFTDEIKQHMRSHNDYYEVVL